MSAFLRKCARGLRVVIVLVRYLLLPQIVRWRPADGSGPVRFRQALETLGGAWVKLGQTLALRFDLLPPEYCYELFRLLDQVEPFGYEQVREVFLEDIGKDPDEIFRSFDRKPFASASIGQVHMAFLQTGEKVAVKVQRPNIRRIMATDISLMYLVAGILDRTRVFGATGTRQVIDEFARWTADELDYSREARNAFNLWQSAERDALERDARVYFEYSTPRVLTMEFIEGIPVIEIIRAIRRSDRQYLDELAERGHDTHRMASHITWNLLNQVYQVGYFHADLHPANLFALPGDTIGYVDFGIVGALSAEVRDSLVHYARNLFQGDAGRASQELMRWVTPSDKTDRLAARDEMIRIMEDYLFGLGDPANRSRNSDAAAFEVRMLNAIRRHNMVVSPSIVTYLKAVVTANTVIYELAPDFDLQWHENRFFGRMIYERTRDLLRPGRAAALGFDTTYRVVRSFEVVASVQQAERDVARVASRIRRRIRTLASFAFVIVGGVLLTTPRLRTSWTALVLVLALALMLDVVRRGGKLPQSHSDITVSRRTLRRRWNRVARSKGTLT